MSKTLLVAAREFRQRIRKRGFLIATFLTPLILLVVSIVTGPFGGAPAGAPGPDLEEANLPEEVIGYVDQAGLIQAIPEPLPEDLFRAYPDVEAADAALTRDEIGAYYVIPPDYRESGDVRRISPRLVVTPDDVDWFNRVLAANLLPGADPERIARLRRPMGGTGPVFVSLEPEGETGAGGVTMVPFVVTVAVMVPLFTSGSYLFQSLTQEKSSRVMEILLVSLRPRQLLTGKLIGLGALTLVQYAVWVALGLLALVVTGRDVGALLSGINLAAEEALLAVLFALGGYMLYAAMMAGVGALSRDVEDSRTWAFVVTLPMTVPIYLWAVIAGAPNSPLSVALSLIPFSAPVAMLMRMISARVPAWQIVASLVLLLAAGLVVIRLMARLFRAQTLLSGESISARRFISALQG
jgi:ABC-2 type transport system permease protein